MNGGDGIVPGHETRNMSLLTEKRVGQEASGLDEVLSASIMSIIVFFNLVAQQISISMLRISVIAR